jgi:hypothetical protein
VNFENPEQIKQAQIDNIFNMLLGGRLSEAQIKSVLYGVDADELFRAAKEKVSPTVSLPPVPAPIWETPAHREIDPFDPDYDAVMLASESTSVPPVPPLVPPQTIQAEPDPLSLVPAELKVLPNWVLWRLETVDGLSSAGIWTVAGIHRQVKLRRGRRASSIP